MNSEIESSWKPEDEVSFDARELLTAIKDALDEAYSNGEAFPFVYLTPNGHSISRVNLVKIEHSDGSANYEINFVTTDCNSLVGI